ncbi:hypothetical protein PR048_028546 [Dryococelus australis]|uniref:Zinc finger BED domain-containing protein 4 n=1 Tax=Dryococelus australis TaxID=614101 RepID=A0ABQ9GAV9_9NEOP|nr:hypothetical protein PR048_028546 [Dryococelus australis]
MICITRCRKLLTEVEECQEPTPQLPIQKELSVEQCSGTEPNTTAMSSAECSAAPSSSAQLARREPVKRPRQLTLHGSARRKEMSDAERMDIGHLLVKMISTGFQPLSIDEDERFVNYCKKLDPKSQSLEKLLCEWNILHKAVGIVTDNCANVKKAIGILKIPHLSCVAHTLNLIVNDAINETDLAPILKQCRALVSHFKSSSTAAEKLRNMQRQMGAAELKLKQDVSARWNSCLLMLERLLVVKEPLSTAISSLSHAPESLDGCE